MYLCCVKQSTLSGDGGSFSHPSPLKGLRPSNRENGFEMESILRLNANPLPAVVFWAQFFLVGGYDT